MSDTDVSYANNVSLKQFTNDVVVNDSVENSVVNLPLLLEYLANQEINEVQVEAGARLNGALLAAGLIDELIIYMANIVMGDSARGLFSLPELESMNDKIEFRCLDIRQVGENFRLTLSPKY